MTTNTNYVIILIQRLRKTTMKKITLTITPNRKETKEQRLERVRNDNANRSCVHASKKAYTRKSKHKQDYTF